MYITFCCPCLTSFTLLLSFLSLVLFLSPSTSRLIPFYTALCFRYSFFRFRFSVSDLSSFFSTSSFSMFFFFFFSLFLSSSLFFFLPPPLLSSSPLPPSPSSPPPPPPPPLSSPPPPQLRLSSLYVCVLFCSCVRREID